jgi:BirA family biotin operon repressor/biotin-[acetyl-CoA-carboxylase] ligase
MSVQAEPLDEAVIGAGLSPGARALVRDIRVHALVDSTMAELARGDACAGAARVCLAEQQSAGRGRRGRGWISPPGGNIYLSAAWTFAHGPEALSGLSLAVGVILCETLEAMGADDLSLKWPNDLLREGRKLAGVLIELQTGSTGACTAIVGVGINVSMPSVAVGAIGQPWSDLHDLHVSRNTVVSRFLDHLLPALAEYEATGFAPFARRWESRHAYAKQAVRIDQGGTALTGEAIGVDPTGALLLQTQDGVLSIHGGEVSLRPVF